MRHQQAARSRTHPATSIAPTMLSSPSPQSSPSSLFSSSSLDGDTSTNTSPERPPRLPMRKRPRISDLRQCRSTPAVPSRPAFVPASLSRSETAIHFSPIRGRSQRRCASTNSANRARSWFASPDRFVSSRPPTSPESPIRLGRPVPSLTARERHSRQRDHNASPFRSSSTSRSILVAAPQPILQNLRLSPPQYTPSFVHGVNALPRDFGTAAPRIIPRQISVGGVWNVGGPTAAQITPAVATTDGRGGLISSGTNAPLHVTHFLDQDTPAQDLRRHEDRLALALQVDPATRVLANISPDSHSIQRDTVHPRSYHWCNNSWTQGGHMQCKFGALLPLGMRYITLPYFSALYAV